MTGDQVKDASIDTLINESKAFFGKRKFSLALEKMASACELDKSGQVFARYHIWISHCAMLAAPWSTVNRGLPQGANHLITSGWVNSLYRGEPVDQTGKPIPWMSYSAIDFIYSKLRKTDYVFEWGGGNSTLFWANFVAQVSTVESNLSFYKKLLRLAPENVSLAYADMEDDYVHHIARSKRAFDVIVIDGEFRNQCAVVAAEAVSSDGFIVFDNSDRKAYLQGISHLREQGFFEIDFAGLMPGYLYKCVTSVFFKNPNFLQRGPLPHEYDSPVGHGIAKVMNE